MPDFEFDKATLSEENKKKIKMIAQEIKEKDYLKIELIGHTDLRGREEYNFKLSEKRALRVKEVLVEEGIKAENLIVIGKSKLEPLVQ